MVAVLGLAASSPLLVPSLAGAQEPVAPPPASTPVLTLPPPGLRGHALWDSWFDLAPFGYEQQEYLVTGTAVDAAGAPAGYTTRIIVTRPIDPAAFNGTVLLDWVNVTAQFENAVDTMLAREMLLREGFAYVHVSAQAAGLCCLPGLTPELWDPVRYAALNHPGDAWAFDIFTQVARAFEAPAVEAGSLDPMGGLGAGRVERILAAGQSQSANRLSNYVSTWLPGHPDAVGVIDGILVHGNVPGTKAFAVGSPVPVLHLLSDFEAVDDGVDPATVDPNYRLWEIAGAAHADHWIGYQSIFGHGPRVSAGLAPVDRDGYAAVLDAAGNYGEVVSPLLAVCTAAGAAMPMHYATSAALHELDEWVSGGGAPDNGPRFAFAGGARATDQYGNTLGGIRLPPIDVPVARYQSTACALGGITIPFTELELASLYGTHARYLARMAEHTDHAVAEGWLLPEDAIDLMRRACRAVVRFPLDGLGTPQCPAYVPPAFDRPLASSAPEFAALQPVGPVVAPPGGDVARSGGTAQAASLPATGGGDAPLVAALVLVLATAARATARRGRRVAQPAAPAVPAAVAVAQR